MKLVGKRKRVREKERQERWMGGIGERNNGINGSEREVERERESVVLGGGGGGGGRFHAFEVHFYHSDIQMLLKSRSLLTCQLLS